MRKIWLAALIFATFCLSAKAQSIPVMSGGGGDAQDVSDQVNAKIGSSARYTLLAAPSGRAGLTMDIDCIAVTNQGGESIGYACKSSIFYFPFDGDPLNTTLGGDLVVGDASYCAEGIFDDFVERTQDDKLAAAKTDLNKSINEHVFVQSEKPALEQNTLQQNNYGVPCPHGIDATGWCIGFPHPGQSSERPATLPQIPKVTPIARLVVPYTPSNGMMLVHITVNGMPTDALLDSGSSGVSVHFSDFKIEATSEGTFAMANGELQQSGTGTAVICVGHQKANGYGLGYDVCLKANVSDTPATALPLIGQSFIGLFRTMSTNRVNHTITLIP